MRRFLQYIAILAISGAAWAVENFPPPEFTTGYQYPRAFNPGPRAELFAYIDVAVLLMMLVLASYLVLKARSRRQLPLLVIFSLLYFGFYRHGCVCAVGSLQNVALAAGNSGYVLPFAVGAFFLLPLLFALFCGRVFCSSVCPLGAAQELLLHRPLKIPAWLEHALGVLPYLFLGLAVLFAATGSVFLICQYDPFVPFFRLGGSLSMFIAGGVLLLLSTVVGRPYCRFLCPYGVLLRLVAPFAKWQVKITPKECVQCHLCADACPYGAIKPPTPAVTPSQRAGERRRLALVIVLLPLLLTAGGWLGHRGSATLSQVHPTVRQAAVAWQAERGDAGTAGTVSPNADLYRQALHIRRQFDVGSTLFGMWVALVIGGKLVMLSIRRRRDSYEVDQAACLACGRCYASCPVEHAQPGSAVGDLAVKL